METEGRKYAKAGMFVALVVAVGIFTAALAGAFSPSKPSCCYLCHCGQKLSSSSGP
jgi:hypothetical protein